MKIHQFNFDNAYDWQTIRYDTKSEPFYMLLSCKNSTHLSYIFTFRFSSFWTHQFEYTFKEANMTSRYKQEEKTWIDASMTT